LDAVDQIDLLHQSVEHGNIWCGSCTDPSTAGQVCICSCFCGRDIEEYRYTLKHLRQPRNVRSCNT